jgi:RNA-directed DNA polymerase
MAMRRAANDTLGQEMNTPERATLIECVVERKNMIEAYRRVKGNKGAAGVDGMTVAGLENYLKAHWAEIKEQVLEGRYIPQAVKGVQIPKAGGGKRQLGIPTAVDRLIQQALHQILDPIFDPHFSPHSYGFRKGKSALQAVKEAKEYQLTGKRWVVDMDLAKFFDEVNHDILMSKIAYRIKDKKVLILIRRYLQAGMMVDGITNVRDKGTPQGGNLSPLLSNIMLDELDKELERRGHTFCRYADDCNIYVKSKRAGLRVMETITQFVEKKLKLKVNQDKSAVARPWKRKFLGYSFTIEKKVRLAVAKESIEKFIEKVRAKAREGRGRNLKRLVLECLNPLIRGWINYFRYAEVKQFAEVLDGWIRRKLRCILWRQWKRPWTRMKNLMKRGLSEVQAVQSAFNQRGSWWNSGAKHMNLAYPKKFFDGLGLISMLDTLCLARNYS